MISERDTVYRTKRTGPSIESPVTNVTCSPYLHPFSKVFFQSDVGVGSVGWVGRG